MAQYLEGHLQGAGLSVIVGQICSFISEKLLEGAIDTLVRSGVTCKRHRGCRVPGAFEIPPVAQKMARSGKYEAVICLSDSRRHASF